MARVEQPEIHERVISTDTAEAAQIKDKRMEIGTVPHPHVAA